MFVSLPDKSLCCGCAACYNACGRGALTMESDANGFSYPKIDADICTGCGACERACPLLVKEGVNYHHIACYAARTRDQELLQKSSSGGMFSELAMRVLEVGGCVFGCVLKHMKAVHTCANSLTEIAQMRGSKYVQSDIGSSYRHCKAELEKGRWVLFTGVPCQIAALRAYLGRSYNNLLTMAIICHGVVSRKFLQVYVDSESCAGNGIVDIDFRNKMHRPGSISMKLTRKDGTCRYYSDSFASNPYMRAFLCCYGYRSGCFSCRFRSLRSGADIIVGDFWGIENVVPGYSANQGASAVIIATAKGCEWFDRLAVDRVAVDYSDIARNNDNLENDPTQPNDLSAFCALAFASRNGIQKAVRKYCPEPFSSLFWRYESRVVRSIRRWLAS